MKSIWFGIGIGLFVFSQGCSSPKSGTGFTLPEGDASVGKSVYIDQSCNACHKIEGIDQLVVEGEKPPLSIPLGGEVTRITTYGQLVTSIINPSHRIARKYSDEAVTADGESKMQNYNDVLTVSQLIDLVAFVQSKYTLAEYQPSDYPMYGL